MSLLRLLMRHDIPGRGKSEGSRAIIAHKPFGARAPKIISRKDEGGSECINAQRFAQRLSVNEALGKVHLCFCEEREREVQLNQTLVALSPLHDRGEASDD